MNLKLSKVLMTLVSCLFFGITIGSIGIGAAYPPANLIAGPFVCPNGKMKLATQEEQPSSVQSITTITWYCVDAKTGAQTELGIFPMVLYSGAIYGFLAFLLILIWMLISANRGSAQTIQQPSHSEQASLKLNQADAAMEEAMKNFRARQAAEANPEQYVEKEKYDELERRLQEEIEKNKQS